MEWQYLHVFSRHNCFAPRIERNRIQYRTPFFGTVKRVRLRITDGDGVKVFESEHDTANGLPVFDWDGGININPPNGAPAYVNPMRSPFSAEVHGLIKGSNERPVTKPSSLSDEKSPNSVVTSCNNDSNNNEHSDPVTEDEIVYAQPESPEPTGTRHSTSFRVKFHSIEVKRGVINMMTPNLVDNTNPKRCVQLDNLGYYAGPPSWIGQNGERGQFFTRARNRYNALLAGQGLDQRLNTSWERAKGAMRSANGGWVQFAAGDDMQGANLRLYVESLPYTVNGDRNGLRDQLEVAGQAESRAGREQAELNRPLIPFEVKLLVRKSNGDGEFVPEAVGNARIDWTISVPEERWQNISGDDRQRSGYGRRYVKQSREALGGTGGLQGNDRRKINCTQTELGGAAAADQWKSAALIGDDIIGPHGASLDNTRKLVVTYASTDTAHQERLGKAVLMFRPSAVAGDRYKLTAQAFFRGLDRRHALRKKNPTLKKTSGTIEIWRWAPVGVVLNWGSAKPINNAVWSAVKPRFEEAYTEIDTTRVLTPRPTVLLQNNDYGTWITGSANVSTDPTIQAIATNAFTANASDDSILSLNSPSQGTLGAPTGGWAQLDDFSQGRYRNNPAKRIAMILRKAFDSPSDRRPNTIYGSERFINMIEQRARALRPRGFVIVNLGFGSALQDAGIQPSKSDSNLLNKVRSCTGDRDMHVVLWDHRPEKFDYIVAHEMAHCLGLRHYENAGDANPNDHDKADHNCVMSYSSNKLAHQRAEAYTPKFCGKCNLKLRGWTVHQGLIAQSGQ